MIFIIYGGGECELLASFLLGGSADDRGSTKRICDCRERYPSEIGACGDDGKMNQVSQIRHMWFWKHGNCLFVAARKFLRLVYKPGHSRWFVVDFELCQPRDCA